MSVTITKQNGQTSITKEAGKPFRILQLTDIHLGGGLICHRNDKLALQAVRTIVERAKADFVIITGDLSYPFWYVGGTHNNMKSAKMFCDLMTELGTEWTMVFGNHDTENHARYTKEQLGDYFESLPHCYFSKGEEGLTGCGNYCIPLYNADGRLNTALMFVDSNSYLKNSIFSGFDTIHDDQIEWYRRTIEALPYEGGIAPSLAFFHIPPKEFKEGWQHCYMGTGEATYHCGFIQEKDNYFGYPKTKEGRFFGEMVRLGSCKGMFVGHDHLNTLSITYQGIRLTYGMSIDYLAYPKMLTKTTQRGGTTIDIYDDGHFEVAMLPLHSPLHSHK